MRRRILLSIIGVTIVATILLTIPLGLIIASRERADAFRELDRVAERTAAGLPPDLMPGDERVEIPVTDHQVRVAVYDRLGQRVAGRGPDRIDRVSVAAAVFTLDGTLDGDRIVARPIYADERRVGVVRVAESLAETESRIRRDLIALIAIDVGAVAVAALVGWIVAKRLVRPLRVIRDDAVRLGNGDFSIHPRPSGVAELDETAEALAETARRLDGAMQREREFSANASHQLRTPITAMRLAIESELITPRHDPEVVLRESLDELERLEATIGTLLAVARDQPMVREPIDVASAVADVRSRWSQRLADEGRPLRIATVGQPAAHVSADVLAQILEVLMDNAWRHGQGDVTVTFDDDAANLVVEVRDEGTVSRDPATLFERRNPDAGGHGVGLALARALAEAEGGRLMLTRVAPVTFRLVLPDRRPGRSPRRS